MGRVHRRVSGWVELELGPIERVTLDDTEC